MQPVLALERLLRIVQMVGDQGAPIVRAMEILGSLAPHYLGLAVAAPLLARRLAILGQKAVYDSREGVELRVPNRRPAPIAWRCRIPKHLGNRLAVKAEYPRRLANRHAPDARGPPNTIMQVR
jgi:hypothetical protein